MQHQIKDRSCVCTLFTHSIEEQKLRVTFFLVENRTLWKQLYKRWRQENADLQSKNFFKKEPNGSLNS